MYICVLFCSKYIMLKPLFPTGMRYLWAMRYQTFIERDISKPSQKHLKSGDVFVRSFRRLKTSQKRCIFCDIFITPQIHLKRDIFFATSLRRLKYILKKTSFCDVFNTSQIYLKKDVYSVTSLSRLRHISCEHLWLFKNIPQQRLRVTEIWSVC